MPKKLCWSEYRFIAEAGDLAANLAISWRTTGNWSKSTTVTTESYPRRQVRLIEAYGLLTDTNGVLRDGSIVSVCELGPRPTSLIELANVVQSPTDRALVVYPGGVPIDIGMCFYVAAGGLIAAGDCLYCFLKYEVDEP